MESKGFVAIVIAGYFSIVACAITCLFFMNRVTTEAIQTVETTTTLSIRDGFDNLKLPELPPEKIIYDNMINLCINKEAEEIAAAVKKTSVKYDVPADVIYTILFVETSSRTGIFSGRLKVDAESHASCRGLMQLSKGVVDEYNWKTNHDYSFEEVVKSIELSIEVGVWYYAERFKNWSCIQNASYEYMYLLYNLGPTNYKYWLEAGTPETIQFPQYNHVTDVMALRTRYWYFNLQIRQRLYNI